MTELIMSYVDKVVDYLDKEAILAKLGLEPRHSTGAKVASAMGLVGLGALMGAGAALALTPVRRRHLLDRIRGNLKGMRVPLGNGAASVPDQRMPADRLAT
jgi:hypothetical protein